MKKLIPALCMLLVAACLMGTSTYAWFAANTHVTADGMQVKAAADGGLAIATYTGVRGTAETAANAAAPTANDFKAAVTAGWANIANDATVKPTSNNKGTWFSAAASDASNYIGSNYQNVTSDTTSYYQKTKFQIKSLDQSADAEYTLKVTDVTVSLKEGETLSSEALNKSIRVAIHVKATDQWYYFAPAYTSTAALYYTNSITFVDSTEQAKDADGNLLYYTDETKTTTTTTATAYIAYVKVPDRLQYGVSTNNTITCGSTGLSTAIYGELDTTPIDIDVYVYYEGEDENCNSNNAANVNTLEVEIRFTATKNVAP